MGPVTLWIRSRCHVLDVVRALLALRTYDAVVSDRLADRSAVA